MPGRMTTPISVIGDKLTSAVEAKKRVIADALCYVGERCLIEARDGGTYTDQTGNLRSSIGYAVLINGQVLQYACADKVKDGSEGVSQGLQYLRSRIQKASRKGIILIVTAGMNYAEYVETKRVVLSKAELMAPELIRQILTQLGFKTK